VAATGIKILSTVDYGRPAQQRYWWFAIAIGFLA